MAKIGCLRLASQLSLGFLLLSWRAKYVASECKVVSHVGREFYFGLPFLPGPDHFQYILHVTVVSGGPGRVFVDAQSYGIHQSYMILQGSNGIQLDQLHNGQAKPAPTDLAVFLKSDVDAVVRVLCSYRPRNLDIFLALPVEALGTDYVIASGRPVDSTYPAEFVVVGTQPDTTVDEVTNAAGGHANTTMTVARLATLYNTSDVDLSGATIHSDKPVAVVSSVKAAVIPSSGRPKYGAETIIESILPNTFAGLNFIIPPLPSRTHHVVKLLQTEKFSHVEMVNSTQYFSLVNMVGYEELTLGNGSLVVSSDKPILIYQYGPSSANEPNWPDIYGGFMRSMPAIENFVSSTYLVVQCSSSVIENYIQIITKEPTNISIDNTPLLSYNHSSIVQEHVIAKNESYTIVTMNADAIGQCGIMHVISAQPGTTFGAMIAGYGKGRQEAYGYPLGMQATVCDGATTVSSTSQPTASSTSRPSTPSPTSTAARTTPSTTYLSTTDSSHVATNASGPLCLQCDDLNEVYLCDAFVRCSPTQQCFVERYQNSARHVRYRTGCKEHTECISKRRHSEDLVVGRTRSTAECSECCHGNFCNSGGCGAASFPYARGPACLTCQHTMSVDDCNTVSYCQPDQVCSIQVSQLFGDLHNIQLQCDAKQCWTQKRATEDKRSAVLCQRCCDTDYCNHECTPHPPVSGIVG